MSPGLRYTGRCLLYGCLGLKCEVGGKMGVFMTEVTVHMHLPASGYSTVMQFMDVSQQWCLQKNTTPG